MTSFYILYSDSLDKYYTGITSEEIHVRLKKHNTSYHGYHFTSQTNDWMVKLAIACEDYSIARRMELYVKRMKSRKFIEKIIADVEGQKKLMEAIKSI